MESPFMREVQKMEKMIQQSEIILTNRMHTLQFDAVADALTNVLIRLEESKNESR